MPRLINNLYAQSQSPTPEENYITNQITPLTATTNPPPTPLPPATASAQAVLNPTPTIPPSRADVTKASKTPVTPLQTPATIATSTITSAETQLSYRNNLLTKAKNLKQSRRLTTDICNKYYVGFGNPDAKILILGQEKGFDPITQLDLCVDESINNTLQWEWIHEQGIRFDYSNNRFLDGNGTALSNTIQSMIGFNPFYPTEPLTPQTNSHYYKGKKRIGTYWGAIAGLINCLFSSIKIGAFQALTRNNSHPYKTNFFSHVFLSEININPSPATPNTSIVNPNLQTIFDDFDVVIILTGNAKYTNNVQCLLNPTATPIILSTSNQSINCIYHNHNTRTGKNQFVCFSNSPNARKDNKGLNNLAKGVICSEIKTWLTKQSKTIIDLLPIPRANEVIDLLARCPYLYPKLKSNGTIDSLFNVIPPLTSAQTTDAQFYEAIVKNNPLVLQFAHGDMTKAGITHTTVLQ